MWILFLFYFIFFFFFIWLRGNLQASDRICDISVLNTDITLKETVMACHSKINLMDFVSKKTGFPNAAREIGKKYRKQLEIYKIFRTKRNEKWRMVFRPDPMDLIRNHHSELASLRIHRTAILNKMSTNIVLLNILFNVQHEAPRSFW